MAWQWDELSQKGEALVVKAVLGHSQVSVTLSVYAPGIGDEQLGILRYTLRYQYERGGFSCSTTCSS